MNDRERAKRIDGILAERYPETTALRFSNAFTLLVAAILAAQCTDERVNRVTEGLFVQFPDAKAFADADPAALEQAVRSTGFYRQKARALRACCRRLVERYDGEVPETVAEMTTLPGVGRKTANLVLGSLGRAPRFRRPRCGGRGPSVGTKGTGASGRCTRPDPGG